MREDYSSPYGLFFIIKSVLFAEEIVIRAK